MRLVDWYEYDEFQSTRPRGARRPLEDTTLAGESVSIHAPARGATFLPRLYSAIITVSIHAPARGATNGYLET